VLENFATGESDGGFDDGFDLIMHEEGNELPMTC